MPETLKNALAKSDRDSYAPSGVAPAPGNATGRQQQPDPAKASDRELDDQPTKDRVQAFATSSVFISIGGVFGVGSDLIRAPLSALDYDRRHDHIVLDLSADELRSVLKTSARSDRRLRSVMIVYGGNRYPRR